VGAVRSGEVVEVLPFLELLAEIDVVRVAQELVELHRIRPVRAFHLAIEARRKRLDVHVLDAEIFHMPVEAGLELVPVVGSDLADAEGELPLHVVHEIDRGVLVVAVVDPERPDPRGIVDRGELEAANGGPEEVVRSTNLTSICT